MLPLLFEDIGRGLLKVGHFFNHHIEMLVDKDAYHMGECYMRCCPHKVERLRREALNSARWKKYGAMA